MGRGVRDVRQQGALYDRLRRGILGQFRKVTMDEPFLTIFFSIDCPDQRGFPRSGFPGPHRFPRFDRILARLA